MDLQRWIAAVRQAPAGPDLAESHIRDAAWVARCVGRGAASPLAASDVAALAGTLVPVELRADRPLFGPNKRLIALLGRPLPAQLAGLLLDEADEGVVQLPQRTLAAMLGVARPSLNKVLKSFERRGHLSVGYGTVRLLDPAALRRVRDGRSGMSPP